jgi:hypothetical protein
MNIGHTTRGLKHREHVPNIHVALAQSCSLTAAVLAMKNVDCGCCTSSDFLLGLIEKWLPLSRQV